MDAETIRAIVIAWLGWSYDPERLRPGNPDYRQPEDVDELVAALLAARPAAPGMPEIEIGDVLVCGIGAGPDLQGVKLTMTSPAQELRRDGAVIWKREAPDGR